MMTGGKRRQHMLFRSSELFEMLTLLRTPHINTAILYINN